MSPTRFKLLGAAAAVFAAAPVIVLAAFGAWHVRAAGWPYWATYLPMSLCLVVAYLLGRVWARQLRGGAAGVADAPPDYWTDRDLAAWKVVEAAADAAPAPGPGQLGDLARYAGMAQALALDVARVYRPGAADPFAHLTLPEVLACGELVAQDLERLVSTYVPGSGVLSLSDLRRMQATASGLVDWYPRLQTAYWIASAVFNPVRAGLQVALSKGAMGPASRDMQQNVVLWFQTIYLKQLGRHLVELNSGRLKVGAARYRELMKRHEVPANVPDAPPADAPPPAAESDVLPVTLAIVGPVKAGKSSLVNAFLGEQRAATDVMPLTAGIARYDLRRPGLPPITLLDTLGFGNAGPTEDDVQFAAAAAGQADLMLLVVPARSAARKPEAEFLARVRAAVAAKPELKMPPVVAVLSHIDVLTPAMEWAPPYDWHAGTRPKEASIRDAVAAAGEVFAGTAAVVPVCTVPGREVGVRDELAAAVVARLGEARGVSLLRALGGEGQAGQARKVFGQLVAAGGQAAKVLWAAYRK